MMKVQSLRSACARANPEAQKTLLFSLASHLREFSTSRSLAEDTTASPRSPVPNSSARQRSRAATSEINSFVKARGISPAARAPVAQLGSGSASASQPRVIDVRSLPRGISPAARAPVAQLGSGSASASQPKVIDVRSLPRGLGLRGRGANAPGQPQASGQSAIPGNRFSAQPPLSGNRFSAQSPGAGGPGNRFSFRGGVNAGRGSAMRGGGLRGGPPGGRAAGSKMGASKKGRAKKQNTEKKEGKTPGKQADPFDVMDPYEEQFDRDMRFGTSTVYTPSLTMDALAAFAPAVPTSEVGRKATVLGKLSALAAAGDPVGVPQDLQAASYAADLEAHGLRFFADDKARAATEEHLQQLKQDAAGAEGSGDEAGKVAIVKEAEESVRNVIFGQAVRGEHEKMTFSTGPAAVSRTWHLRSETWKPTHVAKFEAKLLSLLSGANAPRGVGKTTAKKMVA